MRQVGQGSVKCNSNSVLQGYHMTPDQPLKALVTTV